MSRAAGAFNRCVRGEVDRQFTGRDRQRRTIHERRPGIQAKVHFIASIGLEACDLEIHGEAVLTGFEASRLNSATRIAQHHAHARAGDARRRAIQKHEWMQRGCDHRLIHGQRSCCEQAGPGHRLATH